MSVNGYDFTALTGGGAGALDALDGLLPGDGAIAMVTVSGSLYWFRFYAGATDAEASPAVIAPDTNATAGRWKLQSQPVSNTIPVGCILPFIGGYFSNGTNGGFTNVIGNDATAVNTLVSGSGYRVCNGAALNLGGSSIFNGAGRYLPNLTDSRFLMGYTGAGTPGGTNWFDHSHNYDHLHSTSDCTLTENQIPSHRHNIDVWSGSSGNSHYEWPVGPGDSQTINTGYTGGGAAHNHGNTLAVSTTYGSPAVTSGASAIDNRPLFLTCFYIMKVTA